MAKQNNHQRTVKIVELAIYTAIVILVQLFGSGIKIGATSFSLVLIPIVVGGAVMGPAAGAFLGFVFSVITIISGVSGVDLFTFALLQFSTASAIATVIMCLLKGTLAGLAAGLVYKALMQKSSLLAIVLASAVAPIVNTGIFILGSYLFLFEAISNLFTANSATVLNFLVIACAGVNFLVEFGVNMVLSPSLHSFIKAVSRGKIA